MSEITVTEEARRKYRQAVRDLNRMNDKGEIVKVVCDEADPAPLQIPPCWRFTDEQIERYPPPEWQPSSGVLAAACSLIASPWNQPGTADLNGVPRAEE